MDFEVGVPPSVDGRNVDPRLGQLSGEGAAQEIRKLDQSVVSHREADLRPSTFSEQRSPTYYDLPALKEPVWKASIPLYFYVGGMAGATSVLGGALTLAGRGRFPNLSKAATRLAFAGDSVSALLLIEDLGRPSRFLNMFRVLRPTSPMSVGSFVLGGSGGLNTLAVVLADREGALGLLGKACDVGAGLLGLPLTGYTAVLLANTAVPAWQGAHRTLPLLFMGSAVASSGAVLELLEGLDDRERRLVRRWANLGRVAALGASLLVERELAKAPRQEKALTTGAAGVLWRTSQVLTAASALFSLWPGKSRWRRDASGALGTLGALAMRFAVTQAGKASARDPRATFEPQRQGTGAHQVTGVAAITGANGQRALPDRYPLPVLR